jgi:hypothetical protein
VTVEKRSLEELEGKPWRRPEQGASTVLHRCFEARKKPLSELTEADLRLLIGQDIGLVFVVPLAVSFLERDPLLEAEHYKGDLLVAVLTSSPAFFASERDLKTRVERLIDALPILIDRLDSTDFDTTSEALDEAVGAFRRGGA